MYILKNKANSLNSLCDRYNYSSTQRTDCQSRRLYFVILCLILREPALHVLGHLVGPEVGREEEEKEEEEEEEGRRRSTATHPLRTLHDPTRPATRTAVCVCVCGRKADVNKNQILPCMYFALFTQPYTNTINARLLTYSELSIVLTLFFPLAMLRLFLRSVALAIRPRHARAARQLSSAGEGKETQGVRERLQRNILHAGLRALKGDVQELKKNAQERGLALNVERLVGHSVHAEYIVTVGSAAIVWILNLLAKCNVLI